jgi:hypothetical protein
MVFAMSAHLRRVYAIGVTTPEFVEKLADAIVTLIFQDIRA